MINWSNSKSFDLNIRFQTYVYEKIELRVENSSYRHKLW
jgi:hypothetical protein